MIPGDRVKIITNKYTAWNGYEGVVVSVRDDSERYRHPVEIKLVRSPDNSPISPMEKNPHYHFSELELVSPLTLLAREAE